MRPAQSERKRRVLFLSNGHAEDLIAATIIEKLTEECSYCEIRAFPARSSNNQEIFVYPEASSGRSYIYSGG